MILKKLFHQKNRLMTGIALGMLILVSAACSRGGRVQQQDTTAPQAPTTAPTVQEQEMPTATQESSQPTPEEQQGQATETPPPTSTDVPSSTPTVTPTLTTISTATEEESQSDEIWQELEDLLTSLDRENDEAEGDMEGLP